MESSDNLCDLDSDYDVSKITQCHVLWRVNNLSYYELQNSEIEDCCESSANLSEDGFDWTKGEELPDTQNSSDIQSMYPVLNDDQYTNTILYALKRN